MGMASKPMKNTEPCVQLSSLVVPGNGYGSARTSWRGALCFRPAPITTMAQEPQKLDHDLTRKVGWVLLALPIILSLFNPLIHYGYLVMAFGVASLLTGMILLISTKE